MAEVISLVELRQDSDVVGALNYVLQVTDYNHVITRSPTVLEIPGNTEGGEPNLIGYDIGITRETITLNGDIPPQEVALVSTDGNFDSNITKVFPGKMELREAALTWWSDGDWIDKAGLVHILTPLARDDSDGMSQQEEYVGIIRELSFELPPSRDMYSFTLVFQVLGYLGTAEVSSPTLPTSS